MANAALDTFLEKYDPDGTRVILDIEVERQGDGGSHPLLVLHYKGYAMVLAPQGLDDHMCVDVHSFADDKPAAGGVLAMTNGAAYTLSKTGQASLGWPAADLVSVIVGPQE